MPTKGAIFTELTERKKKILKSIVDSYIESGEPIGSKLLTESGDFTVSSATIRSEMSDLEDMGYLAQPHTSAGRVPTALGFQTYVSSLMEQYRLTMEELELLNELTRFKSTELSKVLEKASKVISHMTGCASFSVLRAPEDKVLRFETVYIDEAGYLIVMICENDSVKSGRVKSAFPVTKEIVTAIQTAMNKALVGLKAAEITVPVLMEFEKALGEYAGYASEAVKAVYGLLASDTKETVHVDGVTKLLSYPEYSDISSAKSVLSILEEQTKLVEMLEESEGNDLSVVIGDEENPIIPAKDTSFVFHPITVNGKTVAAIGVIGPKRMDYGKVIASVNYLASNISEELNDSPKRDDADHTQK